MSLHTWSGDASAVGSYKDQDFLDTVLKPAGYKSVIYPLASKYTIKNGESVTIASYNEIDIDDNDFRLEEDQPMGLIKLSVTAKKIVSQEFGAKMKLTKRAKNATAWGILEAHKQQLQQTVQRTLEKIGREALDTMPMTYVPTGATTSALRSDGTFVATQASFLNIYHLQNLGNICEDDLRIPTLNGMYALVVRGETEMAIKRDPDHFELHQGQGLAPLFPTKKIIGVGNIAVMTTNEPFVVAKGIGSGSAYSGGYLLGQDALIYAGIETMGLKYDIRENESTDFGRFAHMAFYGDLNSGTYSDSANAGLVRGIRIGSV